MPPPDADWPWLIELRASGARRAARRAERRADRGGPVPPIHQNGWRRWWSNAPDRAAQFVSSHHGPFDGLIGLLARSGRWHDVLGVVPSWTQDSAARRARAGGNPPGSSGAAQR